MPPPPDKSIDTFAKASAIRSHQLRDITWDRPVFLPPQLPNPRVIYDQLPFTAHRLSAPSRSSAGR